MTGASPKRGIRIFFGAVCMALALMTAGLAAWIALGPETRGTRMLTQPEEPAETVSSFFDALCRQDWQEAAGYLSGISELDPAAPAQEETREIWDAFLDSFAWESVERGRTDDFHAWETVRFTSLSPEAVLSDIRREVQDSLALRVEASRLASDIYDEDGNYREEVLRSTLREVISRRLETPGAYMQTRDITVKLSYGENGWRIDPDEALLGTISGAPAEGEG